MPGKCPRNRFHQLLEKGPSGKYHETRMTCMIYQIIAQAFFNFLSKVESLSCTFRRNVHKVHQNSIGLHEICLRQILYRSPLARKDVRGRSKRNGAGHQWEG